jgi:Uri superfamily endonuclease
MNGSYLMTGTVSTGTVITTHDREEQVQRGFLIYI